MSESKHKPRSRSLTTAEREEFLAVPQVAVLAINAEPGRPPHAHPTWYSYTPGGHIGLVLRAGKRKSRLARAAGLVALVVQRAEVPYRYVSVEGTVVRQGPPTADDLAAVGRRYLPEEAIAGWVAGELAGDNPLGPPEYLEIRPDRWTTKDFSGDR
ncbi:hypothetical protein V5P93_003082 [Actinokineospora auranticolor]|uniref:Nitroimidazol reductase NimA-like FMN-containing flavoprotein (Pyridoxamine 5'-phosphate oxidase superfamily) n=1 Tax=Actinokineospora auranticolor TaxID=155976 RepID=A0A2S6H161_9PSEU|nr:pyridoxamine 5'-phosphate oxidase family protein [Actinokineospora auranticolor]PPK71218.1 nitroimidazol reductase NimA-like FMN-containing flavoprotein (pyridoxamine 5'-phosphate oxidase superfamily) [Actinokineospora auranticolor]